MATDFGKVAAFWHRMARENTVSQADDATLEMFEGIAIEQLNDALYRFDVQGKPIAEESSR